MMNLQQLTFLGTNIIYIYIFPLLFVGSFEDDDFPALLFGGICGGYFEYNLKICLEIEILDYLGVNFM